MMESPFVPVENHSPELEEVDLYLTMACNLNCSFCSVRANEYLFPALSLRRIFDFISQARELGLKHLHLTGGEPTLRTDLEQIIRYATRKGVETRLITNGTRLNRIWLSQLKEAGLASIMVSIDGLEKVHNWMRGSTDAWARAISTVSAAVDLGIPSRISAVAFQYNLTDIPALLGIAENIGVSIFSIFLGSPLGRGTAWKNQVIPPSTWRAFLQSLQAPISRSKSNLTVIAEQGFLWPSTRGFSRADLKGRGTGCSTLSTDFDYLIVRGDGNLYPCVFFLHDGPALGNISEQPLLKTLIHSRGQADYAKFSRPGIICSVCQWRKHCDGGCRGYAFLYSGDWHQKDPRCAGEERSQPPPYFPLCPIAKLNLATGRIGGSSEQAISR